MPKNLNFEDENSLNENMQQLSIDENNNNDNNNSFIDKDCISLSEFFYHQRRTLESVHFLDWFENNFEKKNIIIIIDTTFSIFIVQLQSIN